MVCAILLGVWTSGSDGDVIKFSILAWWPFCSAKQNGLCNFGKRLFFSIFSLVAILFSRAEWFVKIFEEVWTSG